MEYWMNGLLKHRSQLRQFFGSQCGGELFVRFRYDVLNRLRITARLAQFSHFIEDGAGHVLSEAMWRQTKTFFEKHLKQA